MIRYTVQGVTDRGTRLARFEFSAEPVQGDTIAQILGAYLMYGAKPNLTSEVHIHKSAPVRYAEEGASDVFTRDTAPCWWPKEFTA